MDSSNPFLKCVRYEALALVSARGLVTHTIVHQRSHRKRLQSSFQSPYFTPRLWPVFFTIFVIYMALYTIDLKHRKLFALQGVICLALVVGAVFIQTFWHQDPCPLCILQRYAFLLVALFSFAAALSTSGCRNAIWRAFALLSEIGGVVAAGRHVWVQSKPMFSCGFDALQPLVDALPPARWLPLVFKTSGLCETLYPPIIGLSLPTWSLVAFVLSFIATATTFFIRARTAYQGRPH